MRKARKVRSKKVKKVVRWHENYVVFITPEAKALGWNDKTVVKVYVEDEKIVIEKIAQL